MKNQKTTKNKSPQKSKTQKTSDFVYYGRVGLDLNSLDPKRKRLDPDDNLAWRDTLWMGFYEQTYEAMSESSYPPVSNCCVLGAKYIAEGGPDRLDMYISRYGQSAYYGDNDSIVDNSGRFSQKVTIIFKADSSSHEELVSGSYHSLMALNDDLRLTFKELAFLIGHIF